MAKEWVIRPRVAPSSEFLLPDYERDLLDPFLMKDLVVAVARILAAIKNQERIFIFADYDADGVPGAALFVSFLRRVGYDNFSVYLPDRYHEDHGLSVAAVEQAASEGARLIVTIDCGIASAPAVERAAALDLEVIITDHHLVPAAGPPPALAVVDPKRSDCAYPDKNLCGAGVIFKVVQGLIKHAALSGVPFDLKPGWEKWLLDLVAIATVSDMVPLVGENRALVHFGLKVLRRTPRPGLQQLFRELKLDQEHLNEDDIGFLIGPRLNSASRMAHASEAFELLTATNPALAGALARKLELNNRARRELVDQILLAAKAQLTTLSSETLIVLGQEAWPPGVLGLVASRLVEQYRRPVFLWGKNGQGLIKGSCRSDGTVQTVALMQAVDEISQLETGKPFFSNLGGHAQAGGFSLQPERLSELAPRLIAAQVAMVKTVVTDELVLEGELALAQVTEPFYRDWERLGPFGLANPKPIFWFKNVPVAGAKIFGGTQDHLELLLGETTGRPVKAISFFNLFPAFNFAALSRLDLAATMEKSYFRSRPELRLRIVDLKKAG